MSEIDTKVIRDKYSFSWADVSIKEASEIIQCVKDILILCDAYDEQQKEITRLREALLWIAQRSSQGFEAVPFDVMVCVRKALAGES